MERDSRPTTEAGEESETRTGTRGAPAPAAVGSGGAAEPPPLLGVSVTAVNSALQRAREQLKQEVPVADEIREPSGQADRALLSRYAAAVEDADVPALVALLHEDATFEMPPMPTWFRGREDIGRFLASRVLTTPGTFTTVPVAANGQPALAVYRTAQDGARRGYGVRVLSCLPSGWPLSCPRLTR